MTGRLLTTSEVAELLQMTPDAIRVMRQRPGGIRYIKLGKRVRYAPADVMAWVSEGRSNGKQNSVAANGTTQARPHRP